MQGKQLRMLLSLFSMILMLGGCSLPTAKTTFSVQEQAEKSTAVDARDMLKQAVEATVGAKEKDQKFWYNGYIKNNIGDRKTTSMYEGVVIRPMEAYIVNGRIAGQPFNYYRWGDKVYIKKGQVWFRANPEQALPFDPFNGFLDWLPLMKNASQLPDEKVLGTDTNVIQVKIGGKEWVEQTSSPLFEQLKARIPSSQSLNSILENTVVKTTLWIGKKDHYIYQYSTWIVMPLPGAGYFDQETYFRFYKYGDPGIKKEIKQPEEVEKWVKEFEESIRSGDYQEEKDQIIDSPSTE